MEIINAEATGELHASLSTKRHDSPLLISCNWQISNNKQFIDAVTTAPMRGAPVRLNCEDITSVDTCIALQSMGSSTDSNTEPCVLNIEVTNCQRIERIAIVSEGNVLEIFKEFGEYETTILAEFIDEYEGNIVFLGETMVHPPTTEVSIKFIRTKNKSPPLWIYGIRLFLTESTKEVKSSAFDYDIIRTFLSNASNGQMNQESEMAKRICGFYDKQKIMRNHRKLLETHASGSRYDKIGGSNNEKEFPKCGDNHEQSNTTECKNRVVRKDNETDHSNCEENYKKSDADNCIDNTKSIKRKPGILNYKDFIQTFLSNASNGKSQESDITKMFKLREFDMDEIMNNELLYQKMFGTVTSDSDLFKCKNRTAKGDNERDCQNYQVDNEKSDSLECKNKNIRNSDEECTNHKDYKKSDIDIRTYIDNKFCDMEKRLMERIDEMEASTNQKLNAILERLETRLNLQ